MSTSPLQTETLSDFATIEHFDRTWQVPTKRHFGHVVFMRDQAQSRFGDWNLIVAEAFLSQHVSKHNAQPAKGQPDQLEALAEIDPDEEAFDAFVAKIGEALGLGSSGNG